MKADNVGFIIISFLISGVFYASFRRHELENNYKIASGQVTEVTGPGAKSGGDYGLNYIYEVNHKKYCRILFILAFAILIAIII